MNVWLGQPVRTTDGEFGEVADLIVDPIDHALTHIVVQPHRRSHQARIVPMSIAAVNGNVIRLDVDTDHARQFELVADTRWIRLGEPIKPGETWDVGAETMMVPSYFGGGYGYWCDDDHATVSFDRIPRGECEISPLASVISADEHWVGSVEGLILEDDAQVGGFVVRAGHHGMHHYVIVSIAMIARMVSDLIVLRIDRAVFRALPTADGTLGDDDPPSTLRRIEHRIADPAQVVADRSRPAASRRR